MMKRFGLILALVLCTALLCGCSDGGDNGTRYDVVTDPAALTTQNLFGGDNTTVTVTAAPVPVQTQAAEQAAVKQEVTPVPTFISEYAGATPVVIDPIDKPTPTPLPALTFNYVTYDATNIHLSFEAPAGWLVDGSYSDAYTIANSYGNADYQANMTITVIPVASNYNENQMKSEVTSRLNALKTEYYTFTSTKTASRTLLDNAGVYADYTATFSGGVAVKGRIHVTCVNKKLYVVHMITPSGYFETYKDTLYARFRNTVKITQ